MTVEVIEHHHNTCAPLPAEPVNKYDILRELTAARRALGLSDRTLSVLQALLSFHPETMLGQEGRDLTVFPSNKSICARLNGMACSTMRRHLALLVGAGLIVRRDSPNGKRYVKRYAQDTQAFGFDLTPLLTRFEEIVTIAGEQRRKNEVFERLRRAVSLMRRDLAGLAEIGAQMHPERANWDAFSDLARLTARDLRRKLGGAELEKLEASLRDALAELRGVFDILQTEELSTSDRQIEQHIPNSNLDRDLVEESIPMEVITDEGRTPNIPIKLAAEVLPELQTYSPHRLRDWPQLVWLAEKVHPMMGIKAQIWEEAVVGMGRESTAVVVGCMLERFVEIRNPSGYLRELTRKARMGRFSCGPMVLALAKERVA
jgi:replication initiation protein RepC